MDHSGKESVLNGPGIKKKIPASLKIIPTVIPESFLCDCRLTLQSGLKCPCRVVQNKGWPPAT